MSAKKRRPSPGAPSRTASHQAAESTVDSTVRATPRAYADDATLHRLALAGYRITTACRSCGARWSIRARSRTVSAPCAASGVLSMPDTTEANEWADRRAAVVEWLPYATREAVEAFALRHFDRAESAAFCIAEEHQRAELLAQREASLAVSSGLDWAEQSRRPSYAELTRRRTVIA